MFIKRIFKGMIVIIKVEVKNCVFSQQSLTSECEIINGSWRKARMCVNSVNMRIKWTCWLTHTCTYDCVVPLCSWITHITYSWLFLSVRKLARLVATELSKWVSLLQPEIRTNVQKCPLITSDRHIFQSACYVIVLPTFHLQYHIAYITIISYIYDCREREHWSADSYGTEFDLIFLLSFDTRYFIMWHARSLKDKLYVEFIKNIQYGSCLASPAAPRSFN